MKGEYIGADGRTYRWFNQYGIVSHMGPSTLPIGGWDAVDVRLVDWPAAKAALDELIAEEEEWVELASGDGFSPYVRVSRDGSRAQQWMREDGTWGDYDAWWVKSAFAAGREVALAQVQELVKAVLGANVCERPPEPGAGIYYQPSPHYWSWTTEWPTLECWHRVKDLAYALKS